MPYRTRTWLLLYLLLAFLPAACGGRPEALPSPTAGMAPSPRPTAVLDTPTLPPVEREPSAGPTVASTSAPTAEIEPSPVPTANQAISSSGEIALPPPHLEGGMSLAETLAQRRSVRAYGDRPLSWEEVSQLLWAAQGVTSPRGNRTAPSAGALYPLEVYVVLSEGWYHYRPQDHRLERLGPEDLREALWAAGLQQGPLREAPAVFVITAVVSRTAAKYGGRAERYAVLEAGHATQNLLLQATALGLGAVSIGAFDDDAVRQVLGLPAAYTPLYLVPVGPPR